MNVHHVVARNRYLKPSIPVDRLVSSFITFLVPSLLLKYIKNNKFEIQFWRLIGRAWSADGWILAT